MRAPLDVRRVFARNTVWNYLGFVTNLVTNMVLFPYVVASVGEAAAGIWLLVASLTGYMGLLELGLAPALTTSVATAVGRGDTAEVNRSVSTALCLLTLLGLSTCQVAWFAPYLTTLLHVPADLARSATLVFAIAILAVAVRMPLATFQAVLLGTQRQDRCNQLWIILGLAKATMTVVVLQSGGGIVGIVTSDAILHLLVGVFPVRWAFQELPSLRLRWSAVDWFEARGLAAFGLHVTLAGVFSLIVEQTDRFVIAALRPLNDVTEYSAAWKLYMLVFLVPTTFLQAFAPMAGNLYGAGEHERLRDVFQRLSRYAAGVALPLTLSMGFCAGLFLHYWMGPSFAGLYPVVQVLLVAFAVTIYNHTGYGVLVAQRQVHRQVWIYNAPQAILNLGLSIVLVQRLGILGVALGTMIPALLLEYPFIRLVLGAVGLRLSDFLRHVVAPTIVPALLGFTPLALVYWWRGPHSLTLVGGLAMSWAIYALLFWRWVLTAEERVLARNQIEPFVVRRASTAA